MTTSLITTPRAEESGAATVAIYSSRLAQSSAAHIAVATDRGLKLFRRRAEIKQHDFGGLDLLLEGRIASCNRQREHLRVSHGVLGRL